MIFSIFFFNTYAFTKKERNEEKQHIVESNEHV